MKRSPMPPRTIPLERTPLRRTTGHTPAACPEGGAVSHPFRESPQYRQAYPADAKRHEESAIDPGRRGSRQESRGRKLPSGDAALHTRGGKNPARAATAQTTDTEET